MEMDKLLHPHKSIGMQELLHALILTLGYLNRRWN